MVLYGGTAIALRLGHRKSVDFDFFTGNHLDKVALRAALPFLAGATVLQERPNTLTVLASIPGQPDDHVKVSFFGNITHGRIGEPQFTADGALLVASLPDLLATKLKVILQRIEAKDYQDIAAMLRADASLSHGLAGARTLYGQAFQPSEALKALVYFEGGDIETLTDADRVLLLTEASAVRDLPRVQLLSASLANDIR